MRHTPVVGRQQADLETARQEPAPRTLGLKLIIGYKLAKLPVMLALAIWLTVAPRSALQLAEQIADQLSTASSLWARLGDWIEHHLSTRIFRWGAVLAWLDAITTGLEAILLLIGKAWGEWLVVVGLTALLVPETLSLQRKPGWMKVCILLVNAAVVVYLAARRLRAARAKRGPHSD
jgi:uncharacterized membrane protein (DUF2068 family)